MSSSAASSQGTQLSLLTSSPSTYTLIPQIEGFTGPSTAQDYDEITNLDSSSGYKEWVATLRDGGAVSFTMIAKPGDATQGALETANVAGSLQAFKITWPTGFTKTATFNAYVQKYEYQFQKGKSVRYGVELKVTGAVTLA